MFIQCELIYGNNSYYFIDIEGGKVVIRLVINMKWCKMIDMFDIDNVIQILGFVDKINWGLIV